MKVSRKSEYSSAQFKMDDLRQIVSENESISGDIGVDISVSPSYPGETGSTTYHIEIDG